MSASIGDRHTETPDTATCTRRWLYNLAVVVALSLTGLLAGEAYRPTDVDTVWETTGWLYGANGARTTWCGSYRPAMT